MDFTILDAGFSNLNSNSPSLGLLLLLFLGIIMGEAGIMYWFKLSPSYGKCLLYSFVVNIASYAAGALLDTLNVNVSFENGNIKGTIIAFLVSILVEGGLLLLLARKKSAKKIFLASLVMNSASYVAALIVYNVI